MSKKIGYCGNHCEYCFFTDCDGCKSNNPSCSYANLFDDKKCPNVVCCESKTITSEINNPPSDIRRGVTFMLYYTLILIFRIALGEKARLHKCKGDCRD